MDVDGDKESLDEALKADANCPSIKIEPSGDVALPLAGQDDTTTEEKNDSGIR